MIPVLVQIDPGPSPILDRCTTLHLGTNYFFVTIKFKTFSIIYKNIRLSNTMLEMDCKEVVMHALMVREICL